MKNFTAGHWPKNDVLSHGREDVGEIIVQLICIFRWISKTELFVLSACITSPTTFIGHGSCRAEDRIIRKRCGERGG